MLVPENKSKTHTFIVHILSQRKLSQTDIAYYLGCTPTYVNQIIRGVKKNTNGRNLVAQTIGFKSWEHLESVSEKFWKDWENINLGIDFLDKRQPC